MNIFGNYRCPFCQLESRFYVEKGKDKTLLLLGDELKETIEEKVECDYCQKETKLSIVAVEGILSAFLPKREYEKVKKGEIVLKKAEKNKGIEQEKEKKLQQFHETFTTNFSEHPFEKGHNFTLNRKKWEVINVYKKENTEKDSTVRLLMEPKDEYWYVLQHKHETKWYVIQDDKENNAFLMQEAPVLKENEKMYDITESLHRTSLVLEQTLSNQYVLKAYETLSGIRLKVYSEQEGTEQLEFDVLGDTFEEAIEQIDEVYALQE